ncbi:MAG: hypothetical protein WBP71_13980 [Terracidiphilus sp.]
MYANHRVISGRVFCGALKEVHPYRAFLEPLVVSLQALANNVRQELFASLAWLKNGTVQDRIEFMKNRGSFNFIECARIAVNSFTPNLFCCRTHGIHQPPFESNRD